MTDIEAMILRRLVNDLNDEALLVDPSTPQATTSWRRRGGGRIVVSAQSGSERS